MTDRGDYMGKKEKDVEHIAVIGGTGTGKTYLIKNELIKPAVAKKGARVIILDLEQDYNGLGAFRVKNWRKNLKPYLRKKGIVRIYTDDYDQYEKDEPNETSEIYEYIWKNIEDVMVIVDEAHNQGGHQKGGDMDKWLKKLITRGRKKGKKMVIASQRPAELNKTILHNTANIILKKVGWKNDWDTYKSILEKKEYNELKSSNNKYATIVLRDFGATVWKKILCFHPSMV